MKIVDQTTPAVRDEALDFGNSLTRVARKQPNAKMNLAADAASPGGTTKASKKLSPLENALMAVWRSVLETDDIAVDDNFFLLRGNSLQAADLCAKVAAVFGVELSLNASFDDAATIRDMARIIETKRIRNGEGIVHSSKSSDVVVMSAFGSLPPLFAVSGIEGHSLAFAHIARFLGHSQPFLGLDSAGLDGAEEPLTKIGDIATEHVRRLRNVQPEGPYYLMGACFGARVVYEMAQQLLRDGHEVGLVILLDPSSPFRGLKNAAKKYRLGPPRMRRSRAVGGFIINRMKLYLSDLENLNWQDRYLFVRSKLSHLIHITARHDRFRDTLTDLDREAVFRANKQAGRAYVASPYPGPIAVFWSQDRDVASKEYRAEWMSLLTNQVAVEEVPGRDSGAMLLPPNAEILAEKVAACLRRIRSGQVDIPA